MKVEGRIVMRPYNLPLSLRRDPDPPLEEVEDLLQRATALGGMLCTGGVCDDAGKRAHSPGEAALRLGVGQGVVVLTPVG